MNEPRQLSYDNQGDRLFAADSGNHRILIFDSAALASGGAATGVLGQPSLDSVTEQPLSASGLRRPAGVAYYSNLLYVGDTEHHRVLVYDVIDVVNGEPAIAVIGQADQAGGSAGLAADRLTLPAALAIDNNSLFIAERGAHRITRYDVATVGPSEAAADGAGHLTGAGAMVYDSACPNGPGGGLFVPVGFSAGGVALDAADHRLFVADKGHHRVLVYALAADDTFASLVPAHVLGQPTLAHCLPGSGAASLRSPSGLALDVAAQRLYVADYENDRVVVYDVNAISDGEAAIATFTGLAGPSSLALGDGRLFVAASVQNRVLVYDTAGGPAIHVLGQADFNGILANRDGGSEASAGSLAFPSALAFDEDALQLFVADRGNNRVLIYDVDNLGDGMDAMDVLGQPDFQSRAGGLTRAQFGDSSIGALALAPGGRLFVGDPANRRVLIYDVPRGEAVNVLGQSSFTSNAMLGGQSNAGTPLGLATSPLGRVFALDSAHHRVLLWDTP